MKYAEFEKYINMVMAAQERDVAFTSIFKVEGIVTFSDDLVNGIVSLLEQMFHDHSEWISYWLWELDCGKNYVEGSVTIQKKPLPLKTIKDLYNILTKE